MACVGVDEEVISCFLWVKSGALRYLCCRCRVSIKSKSNFPAGQSDSALEQLLKVAGTLSARVARVRELMSKIEEISESRGTAVDVHRQAGSSSTSREVMLLELRELYEQERRQCSVILRGFNAVNQNDVKRKFADICVLLSVDQIELSGLTRINEMGLFRAKIMNKEQRSLLLSRVKNLRNSEAYRSVYIQRDLTYRRRQEMMVRRSALAMSDRRAVSDSSRKNGGSQETRSVVLRGHSGSNSVAICRGNTVFSGRGDSVESGRKNLLGIDRGNAAWSESGNSVRSGRRNSSEGGIQQSRSAAAARQINAPAQIGEEGVGSQCEVMDEHGSDSIGRGRGRDRGRRRGGQ